MAACLALFAATASAFSQHWLWLAVVARLSPYGRCCKVCFSGMFLLFRLIVRSHELPIDACLSAPGDMDWSVDKLIPGGDVYSLRTVWKCLMLLGVSCCGTDCSRWALGHDAAGSNSGGVGALQSWSKWITTWLSDTKKLRIDLIVLSQHEAPLLREEQAEITQIHWFHTGQDSLIK